MRLLGASFAILLLALAILMIAVWTGLGSKPSGERLARLRESPRFHGGRFTNALPAVHDGMDLRVVRDYLFHGSKHRQPKAALPVKTHGRKTLPARLRTCG